MAEYKLPDVGEGLTEAEVVAWKVKVGDVVAINDIVVEIAAAKSLVELPSPYAGTVTGLLVDEGETVPVGTPIIAIGDPAETPAPGAAAGARRGAPARGPGGGAPARGRESALPPPPAGGGGGGESWAAPKKAARGPV